MISTNPEQEGARIDFRVSSGLIKSEVSQLLSIFSYLRPCGHQCSLDLNAYCQILSRRFAYQDEMWDWKTTYPLMIAGGFRKYCFKWNRIYVGVWRFCQQLITSTPYNLFNARVSQSFIADGVQTKLDPVYTVRNKSLFFEILNSIEIGRLLRSRLYYYFLQSFKARLN